MKESELFEQAAKDAAADGSVAGFRTTLAELWQDRRAALQIVGLTISGVVAFYTWLIFAPGYATRVHGIDATTALIIGVLAQAIFLVAVPIFGRLSDRFGRKPILLIFSIGFIVVAIPFELFLSSNPLTLFVTMGLGALLVAANCAPLGAVFAELVPTRQRATIIGIAYATSAAIFGGTAPYLNTWLSSLGLHLGFAVYIMVLCAITTIVLLFMKETRGEKLR